MGFDITGLGSVFDLGSKIIDKLFPNKDEAEKAKVRLTELSQAGALEEIRAWLGDVQDARLREREIVKATGSKDTNLYVLAWTMVGGFFGLTATLMFVPLPADQSGVIFMLFGALSSGFGSTIAYFFGSSKGSSDKGKAIEAALTNGKASV